jgi:potassium efflux system protein
MLRYLLSSARNSAKFKSTHGKYSSSPGLRFCFLLLGMFFINIFSVVVFAQSILPSAVPVGSNNFPSPTLEQVQSQIDSLVKNTELSAMDSNQTLQLYRDALKQLRSAETYVASAANYQQEQATAATEIQRFQELLNRAQKPPVTTNTETPLASLEAQLTEERIRLTELQNRTTGLEQLVSQQQARPDKARIELASAQRALRETEQTLQTFAAADDNQPFAEAKRVKLAARRQALNQQITMLEEELASYDARLAVLNLQQALMTRQVVNAETRLTELQSLTNTKRRNEAQATVEQARKSAQKAADQPNIVREVADTNASLSRRLTGIINHIDDINNQQVELVEQLKTLQQRRQSIERQLEITAGVSNALGPVLLRESRDLPDVRGYLRDTDQLEKRIADARLQQFHVDERRRKAISIDNRLRQLMLKVEDAETSGQKKVLRQEIRKLLLEQRQLLDQLHGSYGSYIEQLNNLHEFRRRLIEETQKYDALLDEKLFWIANNKRVDLRWFAEFQTALYRFAFVAPWNRVRKDLIEGAFAKPGLTMLILLLSFGLFRYGQRLRRRLEGMASHLGKVTRDRVLLTHEALLITVLLSLPWSLLTGLAGWLLLVQHEDSAFVESVGYGLVVSAVFIFTISGLRQLCRTQGLARLHFRWPEHACQQLRRYINRYFIIALPCVFLVAMTEHYGDELYRHTLGRLAFTIGSIALAILLFHVLHPSKGVLGDYLTLYRNLAWRLRYLWYGVTVAIPIAMVFLALLGYYYTALQLQGRFFASGWLLVGIIITISLILRWLQVEQRRLAWARARAKREAMLAARAKENQPSSGEGVPEILESELIDLETISDQSLDLIRLLATLAVGVGLWFIWEDLLPALTVLNDVILWQQTVKTESGDDIMSISLGNLGTALALLGLILFIARNLPGLLEIAVLQRFAMDAGNRYAVTAITRYAITIIGALVALNIIGFGWEKAQWLVAALSVGLGFGLQEIFANFVSGIIILLERPIRVGDAVTLENFSGTVTRIRIRATTITDWDRKEIIIPNKTFITGSLINWSLSDPITRIVIPVGVAYGSNTTLVHKVLLDVAKSNLLVLEEPEPAVLFLKFGESSLNFEVRVFVRQLADRLPLTHELHDSIHRALAKHGIEIPFPQRDLHIRDVNYSVSKSPNDLLNKGDSRPPFPRPAS